jgi:hypothetical protein
MTKSEAESIFESCIRIVHEANEFCSRLPDSARDIVRPIFGDLFKVILDENRRVMNMASAELSQKKTK